MVVSAGVRLLVAVGVIFPLDDGRSLDVPYVAFPAPKLVTPLVVTVSLALGTVGQR